MAKKKIKNKKKQLSEQDVMASITNISNEVLAAAYSVSSPVVLPFLQKVCRLCESKDGPFLNIFDADKVTAKKIDELMPFSVLESDDLPHKICFRCSAKLEELYEFIQRCIKSQENLRKAVGKSGPFVTKSKIAKKVWEEKLNQNNMSNDDICDALIKKAMAGIQGIPIEETLPTEDSKVLPPEETAPAENKRTTRSKESNLLSLNIKTEPQSDSTDDISLQQVKMSLETEIKPVKSKGKRSSKIGSYNKRKTHESVQQNTTDPNNSQNLDESLFTENKTNLRKTNNSMSTLSFDEKESPVKESIKVDKEEETKPFNIMDYISMIKVNGVGTLFQCKICNRNFLKKEMVESHNCAKNGMHFLNKIDAPKAIPTPEPPKASTVKYIKIDDDMKKTVTEKVKTADKNESDQNILETIELQDDSNDSIKSKPKPKVGPASKTRRKEPNLELATPNQSTAMPLNTVPPNMSVLPSVQFAIIPNINSRFKLCPGPNNIFTLVEDTNATLATPEPPPLEAVAPKKQSRKRKANNEKVNSSIIHNVAIAPKPELSQSIQKTHNPDVIDIDNQAKPYPVGLFQTLPHSAGLYDPTAPVGPPAFTTPAMKKQSYTIVQTGNPSKLLISSKPVHQPVECEDPKKRPRKSKLEVRDDLESKEPFKVTLEDRTLAQEKDSNFFTFINVDPLLQPSYVLPTDNIIQESQISTSSSVQPGQNKTNPDKDKYSCNMCNESFTREKKLLTHIQSHYNQMDEEDQKRVGKNSKKKRKN